MLTYQDLLLVGESDTERGKFCSDAVNIFTGSSDYRTAKAGQAYYDKHNLTIEKFVKYLYTLSGNKIEDVWGANYKLKTLFFRRLCLGQVQYVLGNGVVLEDMANKDKLGKDFDFQLQKLAKKAMAQGKAFGFWNLDHLEVFGYADTDSEAGFCPLFDEDTAELKGGIRFWFKRVGNDKIARYTLYEEDGYTEYSRKNSDDVLVYKPKRAYKTIVKRTEFGGVEDITGENYGSLPIRVLYANDTHESELVGLREAFDCYDFIKSGLANVIDDNADVFWLIENSGGMEDVDLAKFIQRVKTVHSAMVETDGGQGATPHTIDVPYEARQAMLEILRKDIYEDFQALDVNTLSASAKTTQEIKASYQNMDNKCDDFEYLVIDFVQKILELAGIDDNPSFVRNKIVNKTEQTNMVLSAANYLPEELIIKKLPFLTPEEAEEAIKDLANKSYDLFNGEVDEPRTDSGQMDE